MYFWSKGQKLAIVDIQNLLKNSHFLLLIQINIPKLTPLLETLEIVWELVFNLKTSYQIQFHSSSFYTSVTWNKKTRVHIPFIEWKEERQVQKSNITHTNLIEFDVICIDVNNVAHAYSIFIFQLSAKAIDL